MLKHRSIPSLSPDEFIRYCYLFWHSPVTRSKNTRDNPTLPLGWHDCLETFNPKICADLKAPPLLDAKAEFPALMYAKKPLFSMWETPWEERRDHYCIPVAKQGLLMSCCKLAGVNTQDKTIKLKCYGVPDQKYLRPVEKAGNWLGYAVVTDYQPLYENSVGALLRIGKRILALPALVLSIHNPLLHLLLGAVSYTAIWYVRKLDRPDVAYSLLRKVKLRERYDTNNRIRNMIKYAMEYMCNRGDIPACWALGLMHVPLYYVLIGEKSIDEFSPDDLGGYLRRFSGHIKD